jgi:hypothetical protein
MKKIFKRLISTTVAASLLLTFHSTDITSTPVKGRLLPPIPFRFTDNNNMAMLNGAEYEISRPFSDYNDVITGPYDGRFDEDREIANYARRYEGETLTMIGHTYPEGDESVIYIENGNLLVRMYINGGYSYLILRETPDLMLGITGIVPISDFEALTTY